MSGARMSALATLRGQHRAHRDGGGRASARRVALGHGEAMRAEGRARARARSTRCFARAGRARPRRALSPGLRGVSRARRPLLWVRQDFAELETGALSMSGLAELGLDPRRVVTVRAADVESALRTSADALACDALGAVVLESLGRDAAVRSRRQPQADTGRASLRRHRPAAADGGAAAALDRGDAMDRARGAFAAGRRRGRHGARRASTPNSCATVMARAAGGSWNGNVMSASSP